MGVSVKGFGHVVSECQPIGRASGLSTAGRSTGQACLLQGLSSTGAWVVSSDESPSVLEGGR